MPRGQSRKSLFNNVGSLEYCVFSQSYMLISYRVIVFASVSSCSYRHGISILYTTINTKNEGKTLLPKKRLICVTISTCELLNDIFWISEEEGRGEKIGVFVSVLRQSISSIWRIYTIIFTPKLHRLKVQSRTLHWFWNPASAGFLIPFCYLQFMFFLFSLKEWSLHIHG